MSVDNNTCNLFIENFKDAGKNILIDDCACGLPIRLHQHDPIILNPDFRRNRSNTPGDDSVIFILVGKYVEKDSKNNKKMKYSICPYGTALAISSTHVFTAYHIIYDNKLTEIGILCGKSLTVNDEVLKTDLIELAVIAENKEEDWIILQRTDGKQFETYASICPESELPEEKDVIGIKDYPVGLISSNSCSKLKPESNRSTVLCYEKKIDDSDLSTVKKFILVDKKKKSRKTSSPEVVIRVKGGRVAGCCGAPYFNENNKVVGFHYQSIDDGNEQLSDSRSHVSYSCAYVFCRLFHFKRAYKKICRISLA